LRRTTRWIAIACLLAALLLAASLMVAGCAPSDEESAFLSKKAHLTRQNRGIRELIAEEERGSLVPADRFLIGVDEKIVASLLSAQLPIERPLGKNLVVRIERATVLLRDKFGAITLEGSVHRVKTPDRKLAVRVLGGLGAVSIDSTTDMLGVKIAIDDIDLLQAGILEGVLGRGGKKFLAESGRGLVQDALPTIRIPVVLGRKINIPAVESEGIQLDSLTVPLDLSVERVIAAGGKLWVTIDARVGKVIGAEEGLGVKIKKKRKPPAGPPAPGSSLPKGDSTARDSGSGSGGGR
jgi:hypothetical protein